MRKREVGQALILVLILLAIGSLLVVPSLSLTSTSLKSSQIVTKQVKGMYAADAAQEYVMWKLRWTDYPSLFTYDGQSDNFTFDACGVPVSVSVVMRAVEGIGGVTLATDDKILPTKTVEPSEVANGYGGPYTYTIRLEQVSSNTSESLEKIYDIVPKGLETNAYVDDSSYIRVEGGEWEQIPDPGKDYTGGRLTLWWPATGDFVSPIKDFEVRQVKELKFQVAGELNNDDTHCNWVILKPWNTINYGAPIIVGNPAKPTCKNMMMEVYKTSDPEIIPAGTETEVMYTIVFNNVTPADYELQGITDYLPPEFFYYGTDEGGPAPSGITTDDPQLSLETLNGVERQVLYWPLSDYKIPHGDTDTLIFWVRTTQSVSGSYYNEFTYELKDAKFSEGLEGILTDVVGVTLSEVLNNYSWNTGTVIVPAYDSRVDADGVIIDANMEVLLGGVSIRSWQTD